MLFGNINKLELVPYLSVHMMDLLKEAIAITKVQTEDGKYELSHGAFVILASGFVEPQEVRNAEIHKKMIDIQILLEGYERIGYSNYLKYDDYKLTELENDVAFYDEVENENFVDLRAGDFAIFYPNQLHRPLCVYTEHKQVKKAIVKIPKTLFSL